MKHCPICTTATEHQREATPYWICPTCDLWFQDPLPDKEWHGPHESPGDAMGQLEKDINAALAKRLFEDVMRKRPGMTLDVGSNYPWLAKSLRALGCTAVAMDGSADSRRFAEELGVIHFLCDFEESGACGLSKFSLITFIHSFEHLYDPLEALRKMRLLIADDGAVFIRCPDHRVPGIERDMTPGHWQIHPFVHTLTSILQALAETRTFFATEQWPLMPGQRDIVLRPLI